MDRPADSIGHIAEQPGGDAAAEYDDALHQEVVRVAERASLCEVVSSHLENVGSRRLNADTFPLVPVSCAGSAHPHERDHEFDPIHFATNRLQILDLDWVPPFGFPVPEAGDLQVVGGVSLDLLLNVLLGSLADGDYRDNGRNTDRDAQYRQRSANLVLRHGAEGGLHQLNEIHRSPAA